MVELKYIVIGIILSFACVAGFFIAPQIMPAVLIYSVLIALLITILVVIVGILRPLISKGSKKSGRGKVR